MITGTCHCGRVEWQLHGQPDSATACNCTVCRRYGALWAYGYMGEDVKVSGDTSVYIRGDREIGFRFCSSCGCVTHYVGLETDKDARRGVAVNLRMAEPDPVAAIPLRRFEGLVQFKALPGDGRCVADLWS